ncbi:hypothetical protein GA0061101_1085 [Rhizobium lusitanum]|uniref:Uncharacterized protein n=1 Tax=Rhizobium lusitanum TaxID=293958 RepID=A0A1C3W1F6_9HYPH|nr:hypothetical protein GA0061101_1085 [Rhizobium lusitanum]
MVRIEVSPRLKNDGTHAAIAATHIGQAHIAGTGPLDATCGQCAFWHAWKRAKIDGESQLVAVEPGSFSMRHKQHPGERKDAHCNRPILNKARKTVPATAIACRFFLPKNQVNETQQP